MSAKAGARKRPRLRASRAAPHHLTYTHAVLAEIWARAGRGEPSGRIAREMGLSQEGVRDRLADMEMHGGPPRPPRLRPCIRCKGVFASEGAHHRFCATCDDWRREQGPAERGVVLGGEASPKRAARP